MNSLASLYGFYTEMKSTTKRNEKLAILEKWKDNQVVIDYLFVLYDPMLTFGVTADSVLSYNGETHEPITLLWLLSMLSIRKYTGNEALSYCKGFLKSAPQEYRQLVLYVFNKDLKLGIDTKTVNKVIPGLIDTFDVALAFDIQKSPTYLKRVESEKYLITRKLDGVRCIAIVKNGDIKFFSRLGHEYTSLSKLRNVLKDTLPKYWEGVFDGELCVIDNDGKENFKLAVSAVKHKEDQMEHPHYKVFDCLELDEFYGRKESPIYSVRLARANKLLLQCPETAFTSVLRAVEYTPYNFYRAEAIVAQRGYEGLILRSDTPYRSGRTSDLLKVKKFMDAEYQIEDFKSTKKLMKGLSGTMEAVECLGAVVIRHKGNPVEVGSGFSDAQRIDMWRNQDKYIGKIITVKYFEESQDAHGTVSLRFPIFKGFRDKNE